MLWLREVSNRFDLCSFNLFLLSKSSLHYFRLIGNLIDSKAYCAIYTAEKPIENHFDSSCSNVLAHTFIESVFIVVYRIHIFSSIVA